MFIDSLYGTVSTLGNEFIAFLIVFGFFYFRGSICLGGRSWETLDRWRGCSGVRLFNFFLELPRCYYSELIFATVTFPIIVPSRLVATIKCGSFKKMILGFLSLNMLAPWSIAK